MREKLRDSEKKTGGRLRKFLGNFSLNLGKVCRKSVEFQNKFRERLKAKTLKLLKRSFLPTFFAFLIKGFE